MLATLPIGSDAAAGMLCRCTGVCAHARPAQPAVDIAIAAASAAEMNMRTIRLHTENQVKPQPLDHLTERQLLPKSRPRKKKRPQAGAFEGRSRPSDLGGNTPYITAQLDSGLASGPCLGLTPNSTSRTRPDAACVRSG